MFGFGDKISPHFDLKNMILDFFNGKTNTNSSDYKEKNIQIAIF